MASLVNGKIPAGQVCPYRSKCSAAMDGSCGHRGIEHTVAYSCGTARVFKVFNTPVDA